MKQVWKCDHCTDTDVNPDVISIHESNCRLNPATKDCGTCQNHKRVPYEMAWTCTYGWDYEDEHTAPCPKWK